MLTFHVAEFARIRKLWKAKLIEGKSASFALPMGSILASLQDFASIDRLAGKVCIPIFAIACMIQSPNQEVHGYVEWIARFFPSPLDNVAKLVSWTVVCGLCVMLSILICREISANAHWTRWSAFLIVGIVSLSIGCAAFLKIVDHDPLASINVFWEIGFAAYGFMMLNIYVVYRSL